MKRRKFLYDSSLVALTVGVFGKIQWDGTAYVGTEPTTADILGPFYRPNAPFRTDLVLPNTKGEITHFTGTIFGTDGKTPVKNALVEIWHCNENGEYDNMSADYHYRASWKTGADGKYKFRTILPVPYAAGPTLIRPAHILMRVSNAGVQDLVTQIYFKGDKNIPGDLSANDPRSLNRILDISTNGKKEKVIKFDIILQKEYALDAAAMQRVAGLYEMSDKTMCEFYKDGDQLFAKLNGQIIEAMDYKGNNSFEGGLSQLKASFELQEGGGAIVKCSYYDYDKKAMVAVDGKKLLQY